MSIRLAARTVTFLSLLTAPPLLAGGRRRRRGESGQATAEYALVLLGVAALAIVVIAWATKSGVLTDLLNEVFGRLSSKAKSAEIG